MSTNEERERFEAWWDSDPSRSKFHPMEIAWRGWQAKAADSAAEIASARAKALEEAYDAIIRLGSGDKATRFDCCTTIRKLGDGGKG